MQVLRPQPQGHREMGELCSALQHCWLRGPQAQSRTQRPRTRESCSQWGFQGNLLPEEGLSSDPAALTLCTPFTVKVYPQEPRVSSHHCGGNYTPWAPISLARTQRGRNKHREEEGACTQWSGQLQHVGAPRSSQELCVLSPQQPWALSAHPQGGDVEVHEFLQTLSCAQRNAGQATGQGQPCWEDEHLSRNVYFVHKSNTVFNYYEQTSSRVILEVI